MFSYVKSKSRAEFVSCLFYTYKEHSDKMASIFGEMTE